MIDLSPDDRLRYSRHLVLPQVGLEGQRRLRDSSVLIVGAGGLGSPAALYLAAAGVGRIGLADHDRVDVSNLQRQVLHETRSVGIAKIVSAVSRLEELNPNVKTDAIAERVTASNVRGLIRLYDVILDCSDNFATRYVVNDAAVLERRPLVFGSVYRFEGQLTVFAAGGRPCYRCLYPMAPSNGSIPNCEEGGVLGVLPGVIGTLQATEALKLLLGIGESLVARLLMFDALSLRFREFKLRSSPQCALCGDDPTIDEVKEEPLLCASAVTNDMDEITPLQVKQELDGSDAVQLVDVREPMEWSAGHIEGAKHIPLGSLQDRFGELDPSKRTVVYCRSGARSGRAAGFLRKRGFGEVLNMTGGIIRWSKEVDPSVRVG